MAYLLVLRACVFIFIEKLITDIHIGGYRIYRKILTEESGHQIEWIKTEALVPVHTHSQLHITFIRFTHRCVSIKRQTIKLATKRLAITDIYNIFCVQENLCIGLRIVVGMHVCVITAQFDVDVVNSL